MVVAIEFSFPGDKTKQFRLASVRFQAFAAKPFKGLATEIIDWFEDRTRDHWNSEGARGPGGKWAPWAASTAAGKKPGDKLMVETGRLRGALLDSSEQHALRDVGDSTVELGIDLRGLAKPYPVYHQAGSPETNLPRRRVVDMTNKDGVALLKILQTELLRRAREAGFAGRGNTASGVSRAF